MKMNFSVPVVALIAGAALGYCLAPGGTPAGDDSQKADSVQRKSIGEAPNDESVAALRARIAELEKALGEKSALDEAFTAAEKIGGDDRENRRREFRSPREFIEEMKKNEPERYAEMTNHMARFRQRRLERAQSKLDFLASVDVSAMSEEAQATHSRLQELIQMREEIEAKLHSEDITDEERRQVFQEMMEAEREMHELNRQERDNLIAETVRELGYDGDDAAAIADTMKEIISSTSNNNFGPGGPGGPGGRRGRGPGGPGRR